MVSILKKATLLLLAVFALVSCQEKGSPDIEYIPFKREYNDNWGLIGIDGKILFENKYSSCPSPSYNGVFMLKGEDGYEFYTAEKEPKKVAGPFKRACPFTDVVTPVVTKEGDMQIIDRKGKVVKVLNEIDGREVNRIDGFKHGKASFCIGRDWGAIDVNGEICLPPIYKSVSVLDNGYLDAMKESITGGYLTVIFDEKGEVIDSLKGLYDCSHGKYFVEGASSMERILDIHGKEYIALGVGEYIPEVKYDLFVCRKNHTMSLVNAQGDVLVEDSNYYDISIVDEDRLLLSVRDKGTFLADLNGHEITGPIFNGSNSSRYYNGKVMPIRRKEDSRWIFVDKDGNPINEGSYEDLEFYDEWGSQTIVYK